MNRVFSRLSVSLIPLLFPFLFVANAEAQDKTSACASQVRLFCSDEKNQVDVSSCLLKNIEKLSSDCQQEIKRLGRVASQASEQSSGALNVLNALSAPNPPFPFLSYEGRTVSGDDRQQDHRLNLSSPVYHKDANTVAMALAGASTKFSDKITIGPRSFDQLTRIEIGSTYNRQLQAGKRWSLRGSAGSAGDKAFETLSDTTFTVNASYGYPSRNPGAYWLVSVFITNNGPIGNFIPIPGVVYMTRSKTFNGLFGFPIISMQWTPSTYWAYSLSLFGPSGNFEVAYDSPVRLQTFFTVNSTFQNYLLSERQENRDRLTLEEKRVALGVRKFFFEKMIGDLQIGKSFDREAYIGQGIRNMRRGSVHLEEGVTATVSLKAAL